jgi:hypothetical protein
VGSDDGLVHVSRNDGKSWHKTDSFPGVPDMMKVAMIAWSSTAESTLFVAFDGHKDNDFRPHVVRSDDHGASWRNITGDLPEFGSARSITVHPRNEKLVFVGTDFGVYFSRDGGEHWLALSSGLPTNSVQGIVVHPRENDLVIGTHGRGFWVLDELSLLESLTPDVVRGHSYLANPRRATQIRDVNRGRKNFGHSYWAAENPPRGAIIDYWIGDDAVGSKVTVDILDKGDTLVRTIDESSAQRGARRAVWDLRYEAPPSDSDSSWRKPNGRFVMPDEYKVRLTVGDRVHTAPLTVRMDPAIEVANRDRRALENTLSLQAQLLTAAYHAGKAVDASVEQTEALLEAMNEMPANASLAREVRAAVEEAGRLKVALRGEQLGIAQQETYLPLADLVLRLYRTTESWTGSPGDEKRRLTRVAHRDLEKLLTELRPFLSDTLPALKQSVEAAGGAWPADELPAALPDGIVPAY